LSRLAATPPPLPRPALATLAIDTLEDHLDRWILRALPESDVWSRRQRFSTGRLTVLLCDAYSRWPEAFLAEDPMPEDMIQAMRSVLLMAGPNLQKGRMVPCPVDFGWATEWAGDAVGLFERRPFLKALLIWLLVVALLIYFFRITR